MDRIGPRRPGVEWQERMWNHFQPGKANDERRPSLGASWNCRPKERRSNGHRPVLPSCTKGFTAIPQILRKKCWVGASALPQGRDEKENDQPNTIPVQHLAADLQFYSAERGLQNSSEDWGRG